MNELGSFLYRWWIGYVILHMRGKYVERFINLAIRAGLEIWDIKRLENQEFRIKLRLQHFFRLKPILKDTDTRMHIVKKIGLPFHIINLYKRKGLILGFLLFFIILYMLSGLVWKVEVTGGDSILRSKVYQVARDLGIKKGAVKWRLEDVNKLQAKLQNRIDEASWIGIKMDGVLAKIIVVEKVRPEVTEKQLPRHLVAKKKAIIYKYTAERGVPKITLHQLVNPGDVLISGIIGPDDDTSKQHSVSAKGEVWGEIWYDSIISIPLKQQYQRLTGKTKTSQYLLLGKYKIKIWGFGKKDEIQEYIQESNQNHLSIRSKQLPFGWVKEKKLEVMNEQLIMSEDEAIKQALEMGRKKLIHDLGEESKIKEEKVLQQWVENDKVYIKVHYAVIEEITKERYMGTSP